MRGLCAFLIVAFQGVAFGAEPHLLATRHAAAPVSETAAGESGGARLSVGRRFLLFISTADDLVPGTHNGSVADLFVRDQATGEVTLVSATPDGRRGGDANSYQGAISEDGRWIAFESDARNLVAGEPPTEVSTRRVVSSSIQMTGSVRWIRASMPTRKPRFTATQPFLDFEPGFGNPRQRHSRSSPALPLAAITSTRGWSMPWNS